MAKTVMAALRINKLYVSCLKLLEKEIAHMAITAEEGKLGDVAGRHLVSYIKLLSDMKKAHREIQDEYKRKREAANKKLTDAQLMEIVSRGGVGQIVPPQPTSAGQSHGHLNCEAGLSKSTIARLTIQNNKNE